MENKEIADPVRRIAGLKSGHLRVEDISQAFAKEEPPLCLQLLLRFSLDLSQRYGLPLTTLAKTRNTVSFRFFLKEKMKTNIFYNNF